MISRPTARADHGGVATGVIELLKRKYWLARPYLRPKGAPDGVVRFVCTAEIRDD
jgi:hypothetical protein